MTVPTAFIRDDDVWTTDPVFLEIGEFLRQIKVPVVYSVIPLRASKELAGCLKQWKQTTPQLIDIIQHGYAHENHAPEGQLKYEFGPCRTYAQQYKDIAEGRTIMRRLFGRTLTPGFVPSFHAEDINTVKVLTALKVPLISGRKKVPLAKKSFLDLPAQVWLNGYNKGGSLRPLKFKSMLCLLNTAIQANRVMDIVFRHHLLQTGEDVRAMKSLFRYLADLRDRGKLRIRLLSDFLRAKGRVQVKGVRGHES